MKCYSRKVGKDTDFTVGKIMEKQRAVSDGIARCFFVCFFLK